MVDKSNVEFVNKFLSESRILPEFISGRYISHKNCFFLAEYIFKVLKPLFYNRFIHINKIDDLFIEMCDSFEKMIDQEPRIALEYAIYFKEILSYYKERAILYEYYEIASNIENFLKLYDKIKVN